MWPWGSDLTPYGQLEWVSRALNFLGRMSAPQVYLESLVPRFQSIKKGRGWSCSVCTTHSWCRRAATPVSTFVLEWTALALGPHKATVLAINCAAETSLWGEQGRWTEHRETERGLGEPRKAGGTLVR